VKRGVEIEWQFDVRDLGAFRRWLVSADFDAWSVASTGVHRLRDAYLDSADWCVWRSGYALRMRRSGDDIEATLKALARERKGDGAAVRRELTSQVRDARAESLVRGRTLVGRRVRRIVGERALRRLFGLRTRREVFVVRHRGRVVGELALDRTDIAARARIRRLLRIEIEVKAGAPALVATFAATVRRRRHLTRTRRSKFAEGLAGSCLRPPPRHAHP
jgi:inorganic triphosphatase YgiF